MCTLYSEGGLCPEPAGVRPLPPQVQGGARQGVPLPRPRKAFQSNNQPMLLVPGEIFRVDNVKIMSRFLCGINYSRVHFALLVRKCVQFTQLTVDFSRETFSL
jgi:hypothetical protein